MVIFMYYINTFFVYSFLGYLFETIMTFFTKQKFNSGILFGPITPIYGIGVLLIIIISKYVFLNMHLPRWKETIIALIILIFTLTILELCAGLLIEKIFGIVFWDYSRFKFNIGHYISLEISLLWGIMSLILIYVIDPLIKNIIKLIPLPVTIIFIILTSIDIIFTILHLKKIV